MSADPAVPRVRSRRREAEARGSAALPPRMVFRNLLVGPARNRNISPALWPDFEMQTLARLNRRGKPVCTPPQFPTEDVLQVEEPVIYGALHESHFGHLLAETVPRLPQPLAELPDLPIIFARMRNDPKPAPSAMVLSVMDWLNIPPERIRIVERPTRFREVHVAGQGEHLDGPPCAPAYLDLLEARITGNLPPTRPSGISFVTRSGLAHTQGHFAAESYLVACLRDLGVRILYPERQNLRAQMQHYAQAELLIFSEGTAIHGRQLLGRIDQDITILRRRKGSRMARGQMAPRCRSLRYIDTVGGGLNVRNRYGANVDFAMKSFFRIDALFSYFDEIGVKLRAHWDRDAYRRARDQDVLDWVYAIYDPGLPHHLRPANDDEYLLAQFDRLYLGHLKDQAAALIRARRTA